MRKFNLPFLFLSLCLIFFFTTNAFAQRKKKKDKITATEKEDKHYLDKLSLNGLKFRNVGPALTSGRIADFAIHPNNSNVYYVATASGGVWKTVNAGTTYQPIFDSQGSYSIGVVTIDPNNPNVVWVGTGENNNQRSVAYGDGIYKSMDGGKSWKHMGLKTSEHIGSVIVDPRNSDVVYVAAIGPLWSKGGERGVYKTTDGGENWEAVLSISEHTGVNDIVMDINDPDVLYATAYQRRRHVFTYLGGGPESGIHKSTDGGATWEKVNKGLPTVDIGRIGLAQSPADPEIIYAIVEAAQGKSGFYKTTNRGASWQKQGSHSTSGNYYQEIIADPKNPDRVYSMDTWMSVSNDGGKTFKVVGEDTKHVDNHAMWIDPHNTDHWLIGCDGGIYETWEAGKTWDYKKNLPVTQFYKVALDNAKPFYNIFGGTQDNFSIGGPSRTISDHGIVNEDWFITNGGDGFESQVDPKNPNIIYAQSQYGGLVRYDKAAGESVGIQPLPRKDENAYRWNWDAPLAVSNHKDGRVFFAANKLFRSDDRGNSWEVISDDLSQQINRNELKVMDRVWGIDAIAKNRSTSQYGTIVAFSESPINEQLLIVGTDDGLIQITEDGGSNWRKVNNITGVPNRSYVNMVYASQHDENVIYAIFNHHKYGDFKPYVFKSSDKGSTWRAIQNNLPERGSAYCIEEDHVDKNLLFVGTEFSAFASNDGGGHWKKMSAGLPTIAVRDMAIHREENDLVLGTFGRGFLVLDDYSALRQMSKEQTEKDAIVFAPRTALQYEKSMKLGLPGKSFQGDNYFSADNLGPVALLTYYLKEDLKSIRDQRRKKEKEAAKDSGDNSYPTYEELVAERQEDKPGILMTITNANGEVVRQLKAAAKKGVHRMQWDLRNAPKTPINFSKPSFYNAFAGKEEGTFVAPGTYAAHLSKVENGVETKLTEPVSFEVKPLNNTTLPADDVAARVAFQQDVAELDRSVQGGQRTLSEMKNQIKYIKAAIQRIEKPNAELLKEVRSLEDEIRGIEKQFFGDRIAGTLDMDTPPSIMARVGRMNWEQFHSTASPTKTHRDNFAIAKDEFAPILTAINGLVDGPLKKLQTSLEEMGAPYTPGRRVRISGDN